MNKRRERQCFLEMEDLGTGSPVVSSQDKSSLITVLDLQAFRESNSSIINYSQVSVETIISSICWGKIKQ